MSGYRFFVALARIHGRSMPTRLFRRRLPVLFFGTCITTLNIVTPMPAHGETTIVRNTTVGMWDKSPSRTLDLIRGLSIGIEDGDENYVLGRVYDITTNSRSEILALDNGFSRVQVYDSAGVYVRSFGRSGEGPGELAFPTAIAVDAFDNVYVAHRGRVSIFDDDGGFVEEFRHQHPDNNVRSLRVNLGIGIYLSCLDILEQKVLHRYGDDHELIRSFCDSYAVGKDIDIRVERSLGGGFFDLGPDGRIFYTQMAPYEIRIFSPEGDPVLIVHRENDFVEKPKAEVLADGRANIGLRSGSSAIVALQDARFLNVVRVWNESTKATTVIFDLFERDGRLLKSIRKDGNISIKYGDYDGHLYAVAKDGYPRVVKYRIQYAGP